MHRRGTSEDSDEPLEHVPIGGGNSSNNPPPVGPSHVNVNVNTNPGGGPFGVSVQALQDLVDPKNVDAFNSLGGTEGIARLLRTSTTVGLSRGDISEDSDRADFFGLNRLPPAPVKTLLDLMLDAANDKVMILLCIAAVLSIIISTATADEEERSIAWIEGFAILVAVFIVTVVTGVNDFQKEKQFRKLNATKDDRPTKVIRGGENLTVSIHDVQVGDVVQLETGDKLGADGILITGHSIKMDESGATGESDAVAKTHEKDPFFLSGSQVLDGVGSMLVINVGVNSFEGKTMMGLRVEDEATPLEKKLDYLAEMIGKLGLAAAILVFVSLTIKHIAKTASNKEKFDWEDIKKFLDFLTSAITIVVVAVPEGLPLSVTIALAYSMIKMLKDNNLVRHLSACETMGSATQICSDKTGTLTQNVMTVVRGNIAGSEFESSSELSAVQRAPEIARLLFTEGVDVNSTAHETTGPDGKTQFVGSKTESAMLSFSLRIGGDYKETRATIPAVHIFPFSSAAKRMSTVIRGPSGDFRMHVKGASEIVLSLCASEISPDGVVTEMTRTAREEHERSILSYAERGLRTIAVAYTDLPADSTFEGSTPPDVPLVLLGIVGIQDPVRPEVPAAVADCQGAGITVRMVTGDNAVTAQHIATECGIFDPRWGVVMEGPEFRALSDDQLTELIPRLQVLARSSPLDKQILVAKLKSMGEVVAVTGDGTNDAPALKMANVGFSMGVSGTEVAKEASEIVLMDDNFASIVNAVMWGRNVFDSIRRFLQFQVTVNIVAVVVTFIGSVSNSEGESPLSVIQLLWVNLIMDTFAALALATDEPTRALLDRAPNGPHAALITRTMWLHILGQSTYQLVISLVLMYRGDRIFSNIEHESLEHNTIIFNTFVFMQLFNEINCRRINQEINVFAGIIKNKIFLGVILITVVTQIIFVELGGEHFAGTQGLSADKWLTCVVFGLGALPIGFVLRLIPESVLYPGLGEAMEEVAAEDEVAAAQQELMALTSGVVGPEGVAVHAADTKSDVVAHGAPVDATRGGSMIHGTGSNYDGMSLASPRGSMTPSGSYAAGFPRSNSRMSFDARSVAARQRWHGVVRKVRMQQRVVSIFETIHRPTEERRHPHPHGQHGQQNAAQARWQSAVADIRTRQRVVDAFRPRPPRPAADMRTRAYSASN